jgi:hypothetical protein
MYDYDRRVSTMEMARRTIQFDTHHVTMFAANLWEKALARIERSIHSDHSIGEHASIQGDTLRLKDVRGEEKDISVTIGSRKTQSVQPTAGGDFKPSRYHGEGEITLYLNSEWTPAALKTETYEVQKLLSSMLLHEVTHALDVINENAEYQRGRGTSTHEEQKEYFNQPLEIRAYAKQIVHEVLTSANVVRLEHRRSKRPMPTGAALVAELLGRSKTWAKIEEFLTPANEKLIQQIVARELQDANHAYPVG